VAGDVPDEPFADQPAGNRPADDRPADDGASAPRATGTAPPKRLVGRPLQVWSRADELEFARVWTFVDAVFAIALTLLVLDLRLPALDGDPDDVGVLWDAFVELVPQLISFGVAFAVLAGYWVANHTFASRVERLDSGLIGRLLVYLAFVAFLPFPTSIVGEHEANPLAGVIFAVSLAAVSGFETLMFVHTRSAGLLRVPIDDAQYRWEVMASLQPAVMFLATIPLAFVHPTVMFVSWAVLSPLMGIMLGRRRPSAAGSAG